jgi:hypothetical protein
MTDQAKSPNPKHHWLIVERLENWQADRDAGFSFFGLTPRHKTVSSQITNGDIVYCYVSSGISAFSDIRVVREGGIKKIKFDSIHDIYDRIFAYYFTTSPLLVLPREKWIPLSQLVSALELTKERTPASLRAIFQTSIRKLSQADADLLAQRMKQTAAS